MSVSATLQASRTSGPAPLAVRFDAMSTTNSLGLDSWREIGYFFHYGDTASEDRWDVYTPDGGESWDTGTKNTDQGGPIGAHVYETPGTYVCKVRALAGGYRSDDEVTITVTDPDTVYAGTDTICISRNTDTTGSPAGATLLTNQTSWPTWQSNKRYLLRAGQDFNSFGVMWMDSTDIHISRFGSGSDPIVARMTPLLGGKRQAYISIADSAATVLSGTGSRTSTEDILWLRCTTNKNYSTGSLWLIDWAAASAEDKPNIHIPRRDFFVNCWIHDNIAVGLSNVGIYLGGTGSVVMGCYFTRPYEQPLRIFSGSGLLIQHNRIHEMVGVTKTHIKLHAQGDQEPYSEYPSENALPISDRIIIRSNTVGASGGAANPWSFEIMPQNDNADVQDEGVSDVIVESNEWVERDYPAEVMLSARRIAVRGNTNAAGTVGTGVDARPNRTPAGFLGPYYISDEMIETESPLMNSTTNYLVLTADNMSTGMSKVMVREI